MKTEQPFIRMEYEPQTMSDHPSKHFSDVPWHRFCRRLSGLSPMPVDIIITRDLNHRGLVQVAPECSLNKDNSINLQQSNARYIQINSDNASYPAFCILNDTQSALFTLKFWMYRCLHADLVYDHRDDCCAS